MNVPASSATSGRPLAGQVAVVAGATRGAGRGVARALAEAGAIVYCTGRSTTGRPSPYARPETIDETAEMIVAAGGAAVAVRVDHTVEAEVEALFARIEREQGRVDVLADSVAGEDPLMDGWGPFWEIDVRRGDALLRQAVLSRLITARHAARLMIRQLKAHDVAAVALTPGFLRSERILEYFGVTEATWRDAGAKDSNFLESESPLFVGRAVAALAQAPDLSARSGHLFSSWGLARELGFTDVDGCRRTAPGLGRAHAGLLDGAGVSLQTDRRRLRVSA